MSNQSLPCPACNARGGVEQETCDRATWAAALRLAEYRRLVWLKLGDAAAADFDFVTWYFWNRCASAEACAGFLTRGGDHEAAFKEGPADCGEADAPSLVNGRLVTPCLDPADWRRVHGAGSTTRDPNHWNRERTTPAAP